MMVWAKIADAAIALVLMLALVWGSDTKIILGICLALQVITSVGGAVSYRMHEFYLEQKQRRSGE